jgi:hypothetical protein
MESNEESKRIQDAVKRIKGFDTLYAALDDVEKDYRKRIDYRDIETILEMKKQVCIEERAIIKELNAIYDKQNEEIRKKWGV